MDKDSRERLKEKEGGGVRDVRRQRERENNGEKRAGELKERTIWMHRSRAFTGLCMGVAWLVGTVAPALLTSAGQQCGSAD